MTTSTFCAGKAIDMPAVAQHRATFKQAFKAKGEGPEQLVLEE